MQMHMRRSVKEKETISNKQQKNQRQAIKFINFVLVVVLRSFDLCVKFILKINL